MITYGCCANDHDAFSESVSFARSNKFSILQVWYDKDGFALSKDSDPVEAIKNCNFPTIIHAMLDIDDFDEHGVILKNILHSLDQTELIIHPTCDFNNLTKDFAIELNNKIKNILEILSGIKVFLENNSKKTPVFSRSDDIKYIFTNNKNLDFVLDIAHTYDINHLRELIEIKRPMYFHIADKRFSEVHEHLPIGQGDIDFSKIFNEIIFWNDFTLIFEIHQNKVDLIKSREMIENIILSRRIPLDH